MLASLGTQCEHAMTPAADVRDKLKGALAFFHHEAAGGLC